jgi:hypothetical protein
MLMPPTQMAGAYGMTILYGVAPPLMALRLRQQSSNRLLSLPHTQRLDERGSNQLAEVDSFSEQGALTKAPPHGQDTVIAQWVGQQEQQVPADMLPGGRPVLIALCVMATGVTMGQLWTDLGAPSGEHIIAEGAAMFAGLPAAIMLCF